jgi:hypothetical protein
MSSAGARTRASSDTGTAPASLLSPTPAGLGRSRASANLAPPHDFPPVPARGARHALAAGFPDAVLESDSDCDDSPVAADVFSDALAAGVDDEDDLGDGQLPMPPMPWRQVGPRPLSRDPEMEARKAAQERRAVTQEDESLIMRMSIPMRPLALRPATASAGWPAQAAQQSVAAAQQQPSSSVSAMEWGWATEDSDASVPQELHRRNRNSSDGGVRPPQTSTSYRTVQTAPRQSQSGLAAPHGRPPMSTPNSNAAVRAASGPMNVPDSHASPPVLDSFLARQMAFMQLYKERRQAREAALKRGWSRG